MNFFKVKTSWSHLEFLVLKLSIASAYLMVGAYFHSFFSNYYVQLFTVFGVTAIWSVYGWVEKTKKPLGKNKKTVYSWEQTALTSQMEASKAEPVLD